MSAVIHENGPKSSEVDHRVRWVRLVVREIPTAEDIEAERLFNVFSGALTRSGHADEFVLSIFRIPQNKVSDFGVLPKIENELHVRGFGSVSNCLISYAEDVVRPLCS